MADLSRFAAQIARAVSSAPLVRRARGRESAESAQLQAQAQAPARPTGGQASVRPREVAQLRNRVVQLEGDLQRLSTSVPQDVEARLALVEDEIQECRALGLRVAELADLVIFLLADLAHHDDETFEQRVQSYLDGVESPTGGP